MTALDFIQFNLNDSLKEEAISLFRKHGGETGVEVLAKTSKTMSGRKIVKAKKQKKLIEHEEGGSLDLVRQMKDCNVGSMNKVFYIRYFRIECYGESYPLVFFST